MALISRKLNPNRSLALDVFRGLTMAGMILVNNPGGPQTYTPLTHAAWHGWTPCDLVFPSFAFILGAALPFSFAGRRANAQWRGLSFFDWAVPILTVLMYIVKIAVQTGGFKHAPEPALNGWDLLFPAILVITILLPKLERRACERGGSLHLQAMHHGFLIFAIGFIWSFDPTNPAAFRVMGVLQRLGLIYLFASLIVLHTGPRGRIAFAAVLLALYWALMKLVHVPGCGTGSLSPECNLVGYIDGILLKGHLYRPGWEPEGLLHTIPAIATGLLGALAGDLLRSEKPLTERIAGLFTAGNILIFTGLCLNNWFPINKNLWSPSYVVFAAGIGMVVLAVCAWLADFRGIKKPLMPFVVVGGNSIFIYLLSGMVMHYVSMIPGGTVSGTKINIKEALYHHAYATWLSPHNASLAMSLSYVALWICIAAVLYRKRIFVKI